MPPRKQHSFAGGEFDPRFASRTDLARYHTGVSLCKNFIVLPLGGVANRPGTKYIIGTKDHDERTRLVPFVFNAQQAYVVEFGNGWARFFRDGGAIEDPGAPGTPLEVETPYTTEDLPRFKYAQANDILTVVHPNYLPHDLRRLADDSWEFVAHSVVRPVSPPSGITHANTWDATDTTHPRARWAWVVTSVDSNGVESLPSADLKTVAAVLYGDKTKPRFTFTAPTVGNEPVSYNVYRGRNGVYGYILSTKETEFIDEGHVPDYADGPPEGRDPYQRTVVDPASPVLGTVDFVGLTAVKGVAAEAWDDNYDVWFRCLLTPGESISVRVKSYTATGVGEIVYETLTYSLPSEWPLPSINLLSRYAVVRDGLGATAEFVMEKVSGTGTLNPDRVDWVEVLGGEEVTSDYPAVVAYAQQRRVFGNWTHNPALLHSSRLGDFYNFDEADPIKDDDPVRLSLASLRLDEIRALIPLDHLWIFTASAEWTLTGPEQGAFTPTAFQLKPRSHHGVAWIDPLVMQGFAIFLTEGCRCVREVGLNPITQEADTRDLTILAQHLLPTGTGIEEWVWAAEPYGVVWAVRSDGVLLGLTHSREHEVSGWHQHTTDGVFESVCAIPENAGVAVYFLVRRTINGVTKRYIERFESREVEDPYDAVFLDSAITFDGNNASAIELKATGGVFGGNVTLTASAPQFSSNDSVYQNIYRLTAATGETAEFRVVAYTDTTHVQATALSAVPLELAAFTADWSVATRRFTGLSHLEGKTVTALVDGSTTPSKLVVSGAVTLDTRAIIAHIGLPYVSDLRTLNLHLGDGARPATKKVNRVFLELAEYRGLHCGQDFENLREVQLRSPSSEFGAQSAETTMADIVVSSRHDRSVHICLRQTDPLPVTVLSVIPDIDVKDA